ncbi:RNA polymerase sigma-70 factor (ECF subfamily) [Evansella vedderi]|uniref:RNA polymerase sigma-70 factor (ECF subfamily) n=1 Tax=Evansella vedderi TaxID=38282 RepID=A0ABU0A1L0_9BACI|nr:sigma-70 family RNA polymerase sigma factor [Evansella vedderi]MDQ0257377.1 RNA polymerase sigma-70 factor (ECF subfamily) [Evansella vedderi]
MEKFDELYFEYSDRIYSYIFLMVGEKETAEDLTQETFVKMYRNLDQFEGDSKFSTWLISIARNCTIDYLRKQRPVFLWPFEKFSQVTSTETIELQVTTDETIKELYKQISTLKRSHKEVIILRKIQELSVKETAEILGWSEGKVKMMTHRAMEKLRLQMKGEVEANGPLR